MKKHKIFINGTLLSGLIFFSISFITILTQIAPLKYYKQNESYKLYIGFPFKYYEQFWMRGEVTPNFSWNGLNLIFDIVLTWIFVLGMHYFLNRKKV